MTRPASTFNPAEWRIQYRWPQPAWEPVAPVRSPDDWPPVLGLVVVLTFIPVGVVLTACVFAARAALDALGRVLGSL